MMMQSFVEIFNIDFEVDFLEQLTHLMNMFGDNKHERSIFALTHLPEAWNK